MFFLRLFFTLFATSRKCFLWVETIRGFGVRQMDLDVDQLNSTRPEDWVQLLCSFTSG
jgi:hypothetical protein